MMSLRVLLLFTSAVVLLQECVLAQHRSQYAYNGDLFSGVYYSGSRVASTPRRNSLNKTQDSGLYGPRSYPSYIRTSPTTTTTTTARPPTVYNPIAEYRQTTTTHRPRATYRPYSTYKPFSPYTSPYSTHRPTTSYVTVPTTTPWPITMTRRSSPPSYLETRKVMTEEVVYKPAHLAVKLESERVAEKKRKWRAHHSAWKPEARERAREFAAISEYRAIQEGSYYDRWNATPPTDNSQSSVFNWDTSGGYEPQHHRHRHHHETTAAPPWSQTADRYSAFESLMATYRPPRQRYATPSATTTTQRPYYYRGHSTTTSYPYHKKTTTSRSRRRLDAYSATSTPRGSYWYHQKEEQRAPETVKRTSDSVSYISGSYFPTSGGAKKPRTGFAVRQRGAYNPDPATPSLVPPIYPTLRSRYSKRDVHFGTRRVQDPSEHPFAVATGK